MNPLVEDDKQVGNPSTPAPDATADSSTATGATAESPTAGEKEPGSIAEALAKVELEQPAEETAAPQGEEPQPGESPTPEAEAGETEAKTGAPKDGQAPANGQSAADSDAPFHTRKEWQDAVKIGGDKIKPILRQLLSSETQAKEQLRTLKPQADVTAELRQIVGGDEQFAKMREVVRGFAAGDPAVLPILKQMVQTVEQMNGEVITSPDLLQRQQHIQKQYAEGLIDQKEYQDQQGLLKEIERGRAGQKRVETQVKTQQQAQQRQQQQAVAEQTTSAINTWEETIRQRDPDFGQVTDVNDPKHGESLADQVFDALSLKFMQKPNATPDELLAVAERTYKRAKAVQPAPLRQQRVITSQSSSITGRQRPRNMREAMDNVRLE